MTFFLVETYIVKPDKLREFLAYHNKWREWRKMNPEVCKEIKSNKLFRHRFGGNFGGFVEMTEYENLADAEKCLNKMMQSDFITTLYPEFLSLLLPGSYSMNMWSSVP
jgi:hypothetical protein